MFEHSPHVESFVFLRQAKPRRTRAELVVRANAGLHCELAVAGVWVSPRKTNIGARWTGIVHTVDRGYRGGILLLGGGPVAGIWRGLTSISSPFSLYQHQDIFLGRPRPGTTIRGRSFSSREKKKSCLGPPVPKPWKGPVLMLLPAGLRGAPVFENPWFCFDDILKDAGARFLRSINEILPDSTRSRDDIQIIKQRRFCRAGQSFFREFDIDVWKPAAWYFRSFLICCRKWCLSLGKATARQERADMAVPPHDTDSDSTLEA